jgi:ABC-type phosphate transport system substrate-binding protein
VKNSLLKRSLIAGAAVATSVATFIPSISAASADVLTLVGSDTTENVMGGVIAATTFSGGVSAHNVLTYAAGSITVPGDAHCPTLTFNADSVFPAYNLTTMSGSGNGRNALKNYLASTKRYTGSGGSLTEVAADAPGYSTATPVRGCADIARSSSFSANSPSSNGEYYGFALDAVSWATTSQLAPSTLTPAQIIGIYNCTYTDWSEVGGSAGPIKRYLPPSGSGTTQFFVSDILGGLVSANFSSANCPAVTTQFSESRGDVIPAADLQSAIFPYSAGQWVYQANNAANPTIDQRQVAGSGYFARLGGINNSSGGAKLNNANMVAWNAIDSKWQLNDAGLAVVQPNAPGGYPVVESNSTKVAGGSFSTVANRGVRLVYNVISTNSPSYDDALAFVGFDNTVGGAKSALCSGSRASTIASFGFAPLPTTYNATFNLASSTCRFFPA